MFCRKGTEQVEFRRIEVEGMPDSKAARLNRKQKKLTNLLIFTFPSIALRVEGLWARDKPDYRGRIGSDIWNRSLTASLNFCLHPMYRSVVWTEA